MDEHGLREWIRRVADGTLSRRRFVRVMVGLGLTAPMAARMLASAGAARAQTRPAEFTPARRGGGAQLRILRWQAPTLLNPHFAAGNKDQDGSRIFYEPLAAFDADGNLVPILAQEIPSIQNGGLAKDGTWVIWKLKRGVAWHDGRPFTADDVVFNWEYAADTASAAVTLGSYGDLERVEKLNDHAAKVVFKRPTPFWADAFCGNRGMLIPKHLHGPYKGARAREAPQNLKPVGTGPFRIVDFKPGDSIRAEIHSAYHVPNRPFFDMLELKGGGDAVSAARAVLQTGEYDYGHNMQVEDEILRRLEQGGKGRVEIFPTGNIEHIQLNQTDPWTDVGGERSSVKAPHPLLTDPKVRAAFGLLVDRGSIQEQIYGRQGQATANFLNSPSRFRSKATTWEFNVEKANRTLDEAGWKRGPDGVRARDGKRLRMVFQTATNAPRQKTQAVVKQAFAQAGAEMELKSVAGSAYFSSDPANPDTYSHFYADLQMYTVPMGSPDPQRVMEQFCSWQIATKDNKWAGRNITRWRSEEYDRLWKAAEVELDPVKRAALFIRMNDLVVQHVVVISLLWRNGVSAVGTKLRGLALSGWDSDFWHLAFWYREA